VPADLVAGIFELMRGQQAQRGAGGRVRWEEENDRVAHILIVEDEQAVAEVVHDLLVMAGHSVAVARDGATALCLLETRPADLVILDWMLPGLDGLEACRRIRARSLIRPGFRV
jgi:PleD family two-component response regulator